MGNPIPSSLVNAEPYAYPRVNVEWAGVLIGLLYPLLEPSYWDGTDSEIIDVCNEVDELIAQLMSDAPQVAAMAIGTVTPYFDTLPSNMLACDFSLKNRVDYPDLYAAVDAALIVDADHFRTPPTPLWITALTKAYSASGTAATYNVNNLDDSNLATHWVSAAGTTPQWVEIAFNYPVLLSSYKINCGTVNSNQRPKSWALQYFDGTWIDAHTQTNVTLNGSQEYSYNVAGFYSRWRLNITAVAGGAGWQSALATFQLTYTEKSWKYGIVASEL